MYAAQEIREAVWKRRKEIGLSQRALAELAGLSRVTVVQLERGTLKDLSLSRVGALLNALGLNLNVSPAHDRPRKTNVPATSPIELAARTASVSYVDRLAPQDLMTSLASGVLPEGHEPHMGALLDEAPVSLLAKVVEQLHAQRGLPRESLWMNMRRMALALKTTRDFWNVQA